MKKRGSLLLAAVYLVLLVLPMLCVGANAEIGYTIIRGDMDNDKVVTAEDARIILRLVMRVEIAELDTVKIAADANGDGVITIDDALAALKAASGIKPTEKLTVLSTTPVPTFISAGTFTFKSYGYGHGTGMSQYGSEMMAQAGYKYNDIVTHYYTGTTVKTDKTVFPANITYGGKTYTFREAIARIATAEVGLSFHVESIKALIVAAQTFLYYQNSGSSAWKVTGVAFSTGTISNTMYTYVDSVSGTYITYGGKPIDAVFFSASAGKTTDSGNIWTTTLPYLRAVDSHWEIDEKCTGYTKYYGATYSISSEDLKALILKSYPTVNLSGDPSEWLKILVHDSAINSKTGYISSLKVGDTTMKGNTFRSVIGNSNLKSPCFTFTYTPN